MLEGPDLVVAALDAHARLEAVYVDATTASRPACAAAVAAARAAQVPVIELADGVIDKVADAKSPQPVMALAAMPVSSYDQVASEGVVLVLCDVADPGNLGTAIRAAHAAGSAAVVVCGRSADVVHPKVLRATAGSVFHIPVVVADRLHATVDALRASGRRVIGAVVHGGDDIYGVDLCEPVAVVVGSEAAGIAPSDLALLDGTVSIPMAPGAESLNAGVAAAIVCFEARRQRAAGLAGPRARPTI